MAKAFMLEFPGGTLEQYDQVVEGLNLGGKTAPGGILHFAGIVDGNLRVVDVWESQEVFDKFTQEKTIPLMKKFNLPMPKIISWQVHNILK